MLFSQINNIINIIDFRITVAAAGRGLADVLGCQEWAWAWRRAFFTWPSLTASGLSNSLPKKYQHQDGQDQVSAKPVGQLDGPRISYAGQDDRDKPDDNHQPPPFIIIECLK